MELAAAATLLLGLCFAAVIFLSVLRGLKRGRNLPPGPAPLPFLGNVLQLRASALVKSLEELAKKYGPVFTVHLGRRRVVVLWGYEAVKEALVQHAEDFSGRGELAAIDQVVRGFGLVFSNGERWRQLRRFSHSALRSLGVGRRDVEQQIQEEAECLVQDFQATKGAPFDPTLCLSQASSAVICSLIFGQRFERDDAEYIKLLAKTNEVLVLSSSTQGVLYEMFSRILRFLPGAHRRIRRDLEDIGRFVTEKVQEHRATLECEHPRDFIDCFLAQMEKEILNPSTELHLENLVMTALNLFFAGTVTVTTTLRYGLLVLLKYPDVAAKIREEIEEVVGRGRLPAMADRSRMPYTNAVLHEIQRFCDIIPRSLPHAVTRDTCFRGYDIPQGTDVFPVLSSVLRDPKYFSEPDRFDPGHFLDEQGQFKKNCAFLPFSAGKRSCLGEGLASTELFLFLTALLQSFTLSSPVPPADIDLRPHASGLANMPPPFQLCAAPREEPEPLQACTGTGSARPSHEMSK
ncbi:cytochrome P450 2G1 [Alligator mississippiensis]|uniref:Cytochrome P450 2G1-like n=1 Tax=Alligator mississippiensis TaxID=8496 RepID=A0A151P6X6_ALLMI|nr:cytochrome P450 2G1 [Alligator mississippiensis]KYO44826.1 hypothetical protein Y1Q_0006991 [Alligator mississippiensis]